MSKYPLWPCLFLVALGSSAMGDEPAFDYYKEVRPPVIEQQELLAIELDAEIFAASADDLADLRIFGDGERTVPYLHRRTTTTRIDTTYEYCKVRDKLAHPQDDGGLEITFRIDEDDPNPNGLIVETPLRNFEQRVRVFSSPSGKDWEPLSKETLIFDYSRFMDVRSVDISFPSTENRHFRVVIDDVTNEQESDLLELTRRLREGGEIEREERVTVDRRPFRIDRIKPYRTQRQQQATGQQKRIYPVVQFHVEEDAEEQQTIIHVTTQREPLTSLRIDTANGNFSRPTHVQGEVNRDVQTDWQTLGSGIISRIDFKDIQREENEIKFPESRFEQYRIVIDNRDSPPLEITGVEGMGNVHRLLYMASAGTSYRIAYGAEQSEPPDYDTAAIEALLRKDYAPAVAELGPQQAGQGAPLAKFTWGDLLRNPPLLFGIIAVLVVALGWALYSATRRLDTLPPESKEGE